MENPTFFLSKVVASTNVGYNSFIIYIYIKKKKEFEKQFQLKSCSTVSPDPTENCTAGTSVYRLSGGKSFEDDIVNLYE